MACTSATTSSCSRVSGKWLDAASAHAGPATARMSSSRVTRSSTPKRRMRSSRRSNASRPRCTSFNGTLIGEKLGVEVRSPYLEPEIIAHALTLGGEDLVLDHDGQRLGKAPLRRAFAGEIGARHAFRRKDPIEIGSGATALNDLMA